MKFRNAIITNAGKQILTSASFINRIKFTRFVFSSAQETLNATTTQMPTPVWGDGTINNYAINSYGDFVVYASASTESSGGYTRSYGVYARLENTPETTPDTLVFVANCEGDPVYFSQTDSAHTRLMLALTVHFSIDESAIILEPSIAGAASAKALQDLENRVVTTHSVASTLVGDDQVILGKKRFPNTFEIGTESVTPAEAKFDMEDGDISLYSRSIKSYTDTAHPYALIGMLDYQSYSDQSFVGKEITIKTTINNANESETGSAIISARPTTLDGEDKSEIDILASNITLSNSVQYPTATINLDGTVKVSGNIVPTKTSAMLGTGSNKFQTLFVGGILCDNAIRVGDVLINNGGIETPFNFNLGSEDKSMGTAYIDTIYSTTANINNITADTLTVLENVSVTGTVTSDGISTHNITSSSIDNSGVIKTTSVSANIIASKQLAVTELLNTNLLRIGNVEISAANSEIRLDSLNSSNVIKANKISAKDLSTQNLCGEPPFLHRTILLESEDGNKTYREKTPWFEELSNNPLHVEPFTYEGRTRHIEIYLQQDLSIDNNNLAPWDNLSTLLDGHHIPTNDLPHYAVGMLKIKSLGVGLLGAFSGVVQSTEDRIEYLVPISISAAPNGRYNIAQCNAHVDNKTMDFTFPFVSVLDSSSNFAVGYFVDIELKLFNSPIKLINLR